MLPFEICRIILWFGKLPKIVFIGDPEMDLHHTFMQLEVALKLTVLEPNFYNTHADPL